MSAWREAGIEWQRPAGWQPVDADGQRTEPIPVVREDHLAPVDAPERPRSPAEGQPSGQPQPRTRHARPSRPSWPSRPPLPARLGQKRPRSGGRTVMLAAAGGTGLLIVVVGVVIGQRSPGSHPARGPVASYPPAQLADAEFAAPPPSPGQAVLPSLTGVAAVGRTVVAVGSQGTAPAARPLILVSGDGGRNWQTAVPGTPPAPAAPDAVPAMIAGGPSGWLAVGPHATWTSADGRTWQPGPGISPVADGDRVLGLVHTASGFLAFGENVQARGMAVSRSAVLWTSQDGRTWQRKDAAALSLAAGPGQVTAIRWAAASGAAMVIGGDVTRTVDHSGGQSTAVKEPAGVWRSTDGGTRWTRSRLPAGHGSTRWLAGLAATASGFVAVRPGHTFTGRSDAVVYVSQRGSGWRFAGTLVPLSGSGLLVTAVGGSDHGVVVAGTTSRQRVAFVSTNGRGWRQTIPLGRSPVRTVAGVTVAPGGMVVAAGLSHPRARAAGRPGSDPQPFLLLAKAHRRPVGQAVLTGAAASGVTVSSLAAGPAGQVAVGSAAGIPAIWSAPAGGQWSRVPVTIRAAWQGAGVDLASVAHGAAGWLAAGTSGGLGSATSAQLPTAGQVGTDGPGGVAGSARPVLLTSPDGRSWRPAAAGPAGGGITLTQAAAGPAGYVVAGEQVRHGQATAALWWSKSLTSWQQQGWWSGSLSNGPSAVLGVTAGTNGFTAAGFIGTRPAIWRSPDGRGWSATSLPLPAGARSAGLQQVASQGARITALGTAATSSGPAAFAATSADGGRTWREAGLPAVGGPASVTALTAVNGAFVAAGTAGAPGRPDVVFWWSRGGLSWHLVRPPGAGLGTPGTPQITGLSVSGPALTGVGYTATPAGEHPIIWLARAR